MNVNESVCVRARVCNAKHTHDVNLIDVICYTDTSDLEFTK